MRIKCDRAPSSFDHGRRRSYVGSCVLARDRIATRGGRPRDAGARGLDTTFVLSFVTPTTTGTTGSRRVRDVLSASNHPGSASCLGSVEVPIPDRIRGLRMRVHLNPRKLGGRWCPGVYHGEIGELAQPVCPQEKVCAAYVILRGTIARIELHVRDPESGPSRDVAAPRFAGRWAQRIPPHRDPQSRGLRARTPVFPLVATASNRL